MVDFLASRGWLEGLLVANIPVAYTKKCVWCNEKNMSFFRNTHSKIHNAKLLNLNILLPPHTHSGCYSMLILKSSALRNF